MVEASDNAALKAAKLADDWGVLFAAGDISPVYAMIAEASSRLYGQKDKLTVEVVKENVRAAYLTAVHTRITERFLARYGVKSIDDFRTNGLREFGPDEFKRIARKIDEFDLGVQLLVFGF